MNLLGYRLARELHSVLLNEIQVENKTQKNF